MHCRLSQKRAGPENKSSGTRPHFNGAFTQAQWAGRRRSREGTLRVDAIARLQPVVELYDRGLHGDGLREEDVVFEVDVPVQILLEFPQPVVKPMEGRASASGRCEIVA